ncbi:MAG: hypothetical protein HY595_06140 [Candidatus Omnitrophica bacterium]|nr:hypothetical protein [Candidatus Omnitrophota bacterium]
MKKSLVGIALGLLLGAIGWFVLAEHRRAARPKTPRAFYLELRETNRDTFPTRLFESRGSLRRSPVVLRDGVLVIDQERVQSVGEQPGAWPPRVRRDPHDLDVRHAVLVVSYEVSFEGAGRQDRWSDTYFFGRLPATIALPVGVALSDPLRMTLDESMTQLLQVRLLPHPSLMISAHRQPEALLLQSGGQAFVLSPQHEQQLFQRASTLTVTKEFLGPVPKGDVTERDIRVEAQDYGPVTFSTTLQATHHGWHEIQVD